MTKATTAALLFSTALAWGASTARGQWTDWEAIGGVDSQAWIASRLFDPRLVVMAVVSPSAEGVLCSIGYAGLDERGEPQGRHRPLQPVRWFDNLPKALANCRTAVDRKVDLE